MSLPRPEARASVLEIAAYVPGKSKADGGETVYKLSSNESPMGASPKARAAYQAIDALEFYPDGASTELREAIGRAHGLAADRIICGCGSDELLHLVAQAYLGPGDEAIYSQYGFLVYPIVIKAAGATAVVVPEVNLTADVDAILEAVTPKTKLVFLANPNNPTGTWFGPDALESFLSRVPANVLVVLDEAYIEFAEGGELPNGLSYLPRYPNLIVTRTLCKAYGLAGLRVGYAASSPQVADVLNRVRQPFNVNSLALVAACAALDDADYLAEGRRVNAAGMAQLEAGLAALDLAWIPSKGNFLAVDFGTDAAPINQGLLQRGVIVRPVAGYGMPTFLRVSIGTEAENARFLAALAEVLGRG